MRQPALKSMLDALSAMLRQQGQIVNHLCLSQAKHLSSMFNAMEGALPNWLVSHQDAQYLAGQRASVVCMEF